MAPPRGPENDVDFFVMGNQTAKWHVNRASAAQGSEIISGAQNSTVFVQYISGNDLSVMERELIHSDRKLSPRDQAEVMAYVLALEKGNASRKNEPPA